MYALCLSDGVNTIGACLEIGERLDYLINSMYDKMRGRYPVLARTASDGPSDPDVLDALERLRPISTEGGNQ